MNSYVTIFENVALFDTVLPDVLEHTNVFQEDRS